MLSFTPFRRRPCCYHSICLLLVIALLIGNSSAWITTMTPKITINRPHVAHYPQERRHSSLVLFAALPEGYQEYGEAVIRNVGASLGVDDEHLTIDWKAGRIVVTVKGNMFVSNPFQLEEEGEEEEASPVTTTGGGVDVAALAKAINGALDDNGVGLAIAEVHEIEVTTPGASDDLTGDVMFESYKGFDVICEQEDLKTKKIKKIEGKLVERNDEFTIINIKGRMKKMKNDTVLSVKLPKAKKEKGVK